MRAFPVPSGLTLEVPWSHRHVVAENTPARRLVSRSQITRQHAVPTQSPPHIAPPQTHPLTRHPVAHPGAPPAPLCRLPRPCHWPRGNPEKPHEGRSTDCSKFRCRHYLDCPLHRALHTKAIGINRRAQLWRARKVYSCGIVVLSFTKQSTSPEPRRQFAPAQNRDTGFDVIAVVAPSCCPCQVACLDVQLLAPQVRVSFCRSAGQLSLFPFSRSYPVPRTHFGFADSSR